MNIQYISGATQIMTEVNTPVIPQVGSELLLHPNLYKVVRVVHDYERKNPMNSHKNPRVECMEVQVYLEEKAYG